MLTPMHPFTQAAKLGVPTGDFPEAHQIVSTDPRDMVRALLCGLDMFLTMGLHEGRAGGVQGCVRAGGEGLFV